MTRWRILQREPHVKWRDDLGDFDSYGMAFYTIQQLHESGALNHDEVLVLRPEGLRKRKPSSGGRLNVRRGAQQR